MENNFFDKFIKDKLNQLDAGFDPEHWEQFEQQLDASDLPQGETPVEDELDILAKSHLENIIAPNVESQWDLFEQQLDAVEQPDQLIEDAELDGVAYEQLHDLRKPYRPEHWQLLSNRLDYVYSWKYKIYKYKLAEIGLMLLLLITLINFLPNQPVIQRIADLPESIQSKKDNVISNDTQLASPSIISKSNDSKVAKTTANSIVNNSSSIDQSTKTVSTETTKSKSVTNDNQVIKETWPAESNTTVANTTPVQTSTISHQLKPINPIAASTNVVEEANATPTQVQSLMTSVDPIKPLAFSPDDELNTALPAAEQLILPDVFRRMRIGMFASSDFNYILTPHNTKLQLPSYEQFFQGYGGGISLNFQISQRLAVETGIIYSSIYYEPLNFNVAVTGNIRGLSGKGLRSASLDVIKLPLNIRYNISMNDKWRFYTLAGASYNAAAYTHYQIVNTLPAGSSAAAFPAPAPRPGERTSTQDQERYNGFMENGGKLQGNTYLTANVGLGLERYLNPRWSIFVQPVYQHQLLDNSEGFGPNRDRFNSISTFIGIRTSLKK